MNVARPVEGPRGEEALATVGSRGFRLDFYEMTNSESDMLARHP
jgi:hypothetical protein